MMERSEVKIKARAEARPAPPKGRMTYEEFLEWCDEDTWAEWVDGEVMMLTPASNRHQDLSDFLAFIMRAFVEAHNLGVVRSAPFQMKTGPKLPGREPDILFVAWEHIERLEERYLDGPADLVVEIVSPESMGRDRGDKFYEYEEGGVKEYWLIDPQRRRAEFYRLGEEGWYQLMPVDEEGIYRSEVISGFWLKTSWLWEEPLPRVLDVLRELGVA
jgi:Uma2 family endonuclease